MPAPSSNRKAVRHSGATGVSSSTRSGAPLPGRASNYPASIAAVMRASANLSMPCGKLGVGCVMLASEFVGQLGGQTGERLRGRLPVSLDRHQANENPPCLPSLLGSLRRRQPILIPLPNDELNRQRARRHQNLGIAFGRHRRHPANGPRIHQGILQRESTAIGKPCQEESVLKRVRTVELGQNRREIALCLQRVRQSLLAAEIGAK